MADFFHRNWQRKRWPWGVMFFLPALIVGILTLASHPPSPAFHTATDLVADPIAAPSILSQAQPSSPLQGFPAPQPHPLPLTLANWQDSNPADDYFSQVKPTKLGYLVWSQFPIKVYVEYAADTSSPPTRQLQVWAETVQQAVQEWQAYLPLTLVQQPDQADIKILAETPPLRRLAPAASDDAANRNSLLPLPRARAAETRYKFYLQRSDTAPPILAHRFTISLKPGQSIRSIHAAARHELGHALGIWGHSPLKSDVLYFAQVRHPPPISARDLNTLKRIYQQPTRLGWPLPR